MHRLQWPDGLGIRFFLVLLPFLWCFSCPVHADAPQVEPSLLHQHRIPSHPGVRQLPNPESDKERYDLLPIAQGQAILLDKKTGETFINSYCPQDYHQMQLIPNRLYFPMDVNPTAVYLHYPQRCWAAMQNPAKQHMKIVLFPKKPGTQATGTENKRFR